jgi:hypothetical protein
MQVFLDLAAFVTVALRLLGLMLGFSERVFGIPHDFADGFLGFAHGWSPLSEVLRSAHDAFLPAFVRSPTSEMGIGIFIACFI